MFIYHIEEPTQEALRERVLKDFAVAISGSAPTAPVAPAPVAEQPTAAADEGPKRTRRTKAEMEAAKAAETASAADAAPPAEKAPTARVVTREQVREAMGLMIARHPQKGAAATQFLQQHGGGAKNISSTDEALLAPLYDAVVAWLEANPASDPTA